MADDFQRNSWNTNKNQKSETTPLLNSPDLPQQPVMPSVPNVSTGYAANTGEPVPPQPPGGQPPVYGAPQPPASPYPPIRHNSPIRLRHPIPTTITNSSSPAMCRPIIRARLRPTKTAMGWRSLPLCSVSSRL